jgi:hypothetical protein
MEGGRAIDNVTNNSDAIELGIQNWLFSIKKQVRLMAILMCCQGWPRLQFLHTSICDRAEAEAKEVLKGEMN